jgi:hypothetical protein
MDISVFRAATSAGRLNNPHNRLAKARARAVHGWWPALAVDYNRDRTVGREM